MPLYFQKMWLKRGILVIAVVFVSVIVWSGIKIAEKNQTQESDVNLESINKEALDAYRNGDYDKSVKLYTDLLKVSDVGESKANARVSLATSLFFRNKDGDRRAAGDLFKENIADSGLPEKTRAASAAMLLDFFESSNDTQIVKDVVFSGEPFGEALAKTGRLDIAYREAYKKVYEVYPFPVPAFRVAHWYGRSLLYADVLDTKKELFRQELIEWTKKGREAIEKESLQNYSRTKQATVYQLAALSHVYVGESFPQDSAERAINFDIVEKFFGQALSVIRPEDTVESYQSGQFVRFYYASFLARNYGETKMDDIKRLISPLLVAPEKFKGVKTNFDDFLVKTAKKPESDYNRRNLSDIIKVVPDLKASLSERGISFE